MAILNRTDMDEINAVFIHASIDDMRLSVAEFRIYAHLAQRGTSTGEAWPRLNDVADVCGLHVDTVRTAIARLVARGLVQRELVPGAPSRYRIRDPHEWEHGNEDGTAEEADRVMFVHSALDNAGLSPQCFRVYCHLARRAGVGGAWPALDSIAETCRIRREGVQEHLQTLLESGMLLKEKRPGTSSVYKLTPPSTWTVTHRPSFRGTPSASFRGTGIGKEGLGDPRKEGLTVPRKEGLRSISNEVNPLSNSEGGGAEGGFGVRPEPTFEESISTKLEDFIRRRRKLMSIPNRKKWANEVKKLVEMVGDGARVQSVLEWYVTNSDQPYMPRVHSAEQFRTKFTQIEERMGELRPRVEKIELTLAQERVLASVQTFTWPDQSALMRLIVVSWERYEHHLAHRRRVLSQLKQRVASGRDEWNEAFRLVSFLETSAPDSAPIAHFVENWVRWVADTVLSWSAWSGNLESFAFAPTHKEFQRLGVQAARDHGRSRAWHDYQLILNET